MLITASFEDIIYIVIGVIWIAYSIYKGTRKAKSKDNQPVDEIETEDGSKSVFESFFDDIIVKDKEAEVVPQSDEMVFAEEPGLKTETSEEIFSYDDYYEESNQHVSFDVYEDKAGLQAELEQEKQVKPIKKRKKPRIDLRKAVVYSEILNRRYF